MKTIYKYTLESPQSEIQMPAGAKILTAQMQGVQMVLWAECVAGEEAKDTRRIEVFGTGHKMPDAQRTYIATVPDGDYIWHVYENLNNR